MGHLGCSCRVHLGRNEKQGGRATGQRKGKYLESTWSLCGLLFVAVAHLDLNPICILMPSMFEYNLLMKRMDLGVLCPVP